MPDRPKTLLEGFGEATEQVVVLRAEVERQRGLREATQQTLAAVTAERDHYGAEARRLHEALGQIARTISLEGTTIEQARRARFIATAALNLTQPPRDPAGPLQFAQFRMT